MIENNSANKAEDLNREEIEETNEPQENKEKKINFEEALQELDKIVQDLQRGQKPLDESLELFRRGTKLVEVLRKELEQAEQEVKELLDDGSQIDYVLPND